MSASTPSRPVRTFGVADESALETESADVTPSSARRILGRISFSRNNQRPSFGARWRSSGSAGGTPGAEGDEAGTPSERPPIPSALHATEPDATPLPALSMTVLSITMLGEFLSANVSTPFLMFMVEGFGEITDKAEVAFWTGLLVSTFFLTQFLTSLLWATVANRHGQRIVLTTSLLGSAVTCLVFGTSTSLEQAIAVRLLQGIFAGAVGVARGCVTSVTDPSNEGRAYAILGFCWGFGGVAGAIIGGTFESPAVKWPDVFSKFPLLVKYPYLLPCAMAALVTFIGSILSLFLARDGGPRTGAIYLPEKPDSTPTHTMPSTILEEDPESPSPSPITLPDEIGASASPGGRMGSLRKKIGARVSGYFAQRVHDAHPEGLSPGAGASMPMNVPGRRTFSRTSRANGSAYGYTSSLPHRQSVRRASIASRRSTMTRRGSMAVGSLGATEGTAAGQDLNFAQRLLMANENAVTNIADLWVAAAMNVDADEDPFESDSEDGDLEDAGDAGSPNTSPRAGRPSRRSTFGVRPSFSSRRPSRTQLYSTLSQRRSTDEESGSPVARRISAVPSIFAHPGVRTPPAVTDAQQLVPRGSGDDVAPLVSPMSEHPPERQGEGELVETVFEKPPSLASQLPVSVIIQYGLLALHTTTHDQVFLSYLVSDYETGGLNLNAGHFAQLIALMCLCQIAYQFYLYPNIGPPRGRFSHLAMFRLGSLLFIPAYLTVILYRAFASSTDDGNFVLMAALAISTALRYCGATFGYTAISILLNYMTPPPVVGFANGVAQSIVSLARCFGPLLGGYLWAMSVEEDPSGYWIGFVACAGVCAFAVMSSFMIR